MNSLSLTAANDPQASMDPSHFTLGHELKLRAFIQKRVLNPEDAEDLLQLTYLEAWRNQEKFQGQARPETWLCGIAQNLIRNHFRRFYARPQHSLFDDMEHPDQDSSTDLGIHLDRHRLLERTFEAMAQLPREMRDTLRIAIETEGSYSDTAEALGVPIGTVRSRLSRAREQLKRSVYQEASA